MNSSLTVNQTDLWKQTSNIGYTRYTNVADGTNQIVLWGHLEWFSAFISAAVTGGLLFLGGRFIYKLIYPISSVWPY